jgi:hypothetical protein
MTALDPFALGGRTDEIIVDHDELNDLRFLVDEPVLGPLARELFEVNEEWGDMPAGDPRDGALLARIKELDKETAACPAQTIGGVAWRLRDLNLVIQDEDGVSDWTRAAMQAACDDATRLAEAGRHPKGGAA